MKKRFLAALATGLLVVGMGGVAQALSTSDMTLGGSNATAVLGPFVDSMAQEIGRALQYFFSSTPHHRVDHILLAGGSAPLPGLTESVAQQSGFACAVVNPFEGMAVGSAVRMKKMAREAPSYLTSCGLAMRRFLQ